jgi:hypothetical protein
LPPTLAGREILPAAKKVLPGYGILRRFAILQNRNQAAGFIDFGHITQANNL